MKKKFLVINGPNLNFLGKREPEVYGDLSLKQIIEYTETKLQSFNLDVEWFQSNLEGEIVSKIQSLSLETISALIINPGGYSHTSIAILDAIKVLSIPVIEVHLSNTHAREEFRKERPVATGVTSVMEGLGKNVYHTAIYSQL
ncbi:MAG: 3-dehydroquinate dehydratase [Bdellovibrionales bacterium]|jgi:3-dehydroquinate dehydratase II|nr:3-dehydroquinate dehydratase [Bdellovibrionales bacterium]